MVSEGSVAVMTAANRSSRRSLNSPSSLSSRMPRVAEGSSPASILAEEKIAKVGREFESCGVYS